MSAWQNRPLEEFYPILYLDAIQVKIRADHRVDNRGAYIAVGVDLEGVKHVLGIMNIEDKRARERATQSEKRGKERTAKGKLVEGQITTNWNQALAQLAVPYPDRFEKYI